MSSAQIRQRLHDYIDIVEDKKLKAIYTLLQDYIDGGYQLTEEQKAELDRRLHDYKMASVEAIAGMKQLLLLIRHYSTAKTVNGIFVRPASGSRYGITQFCDLV